MKLEEIKNRTKEAVNYLVAALESGQSEVLTQYFIGNGPVSSLQLWQHHADCAAETRCNQRRWHSHMELAWPLRRNAGKKAF